MESKQKNQLIYYSGYFKSFTDIYKHENRFRECAVENVKNIIHELIYPVKMRRYLEVKSTHPMYQFKNKNEMAYLVDGIFIRVSYINVFPGGTRDLRS